MFPKHRGFGGFNDFCRLAYKLHDRTSVFIYRPLKPLPKFAVCHAFSICRQRVQALANTGGYIGSVCFRIRLTCCNRTHCIQLRS